MTRRAAGSRRWHSSCSSSPRSRSSRSSSISATGVVRATADAGLLVIGLSERWRTEGLGEVRSLIAGKASAPILFVRRGTRPGALSSEEAGVTRFSWSRAGGVVSA